MQLRIINGSPVCYHYHFLKRAKFLTYLSVVSERSALGEAVGRSTQFPLSEARWAKHTISVEGRALGEAHNFG